MEHNFAERHASEVSPENLETEEFDSEEYEVEDDPLENNLQASLIPTFHTEIIPMKRPKTVQWNLSISDSDLRKLKAGYKPDGMDDRWLMRVDVLDDDEGMDITIARSWTEIRHFILHLRKKDTGMEIATLTWEQNPGPAYKSEEDAKMEAIMLCREMGECEFSNLPEYNRDGMFKTFWKDRPKSDDTKPDSE